MKTPALFCRGVQLRLALTGDPGARLPGWCRRHLAHCASCRETLAAECDLVRRLRDTAPAARRSAPAGLVPRTLARLGSTPHPEPVHTAPAVPGFKPAWALAAIGLLILAGWFLRPGPTQPAGREATARPAPALPVLSATLETDPLTTLVARFNDPLQDEWNRVLGDLRTAGNSLAAAFLPERLPLTTGPGP